MWTTQLNFYVCTFISEACTISTDVFVFSYMTNLDKICGNTWQRVRDLLPSDSACCHFLYPKSSWITVLQCYYTTVCFFSVHVIKVLSVTNPHCKVAWKTFLLWLCREFIAYCVVGNLFCFIPNAYYTSCPKSILAFSKFCIIHIVIT